VNATTAIADGVSSLLGGSKVKRQQQEIENLRTEKDNMSQEIKDLKQNIQTLQKEHETTIDKLKQELTKIHLLFPK
jgi:peptidoglycan hydrolase CwlO-like protein